MVEIQKRFIWSVTPRIKDETPSSNFKNGGLKNVDKNKDSEPLMLLDKKTLRRLLS